MTTTRGPLVAVPSPRAQRPAAGARAPVRHPATARPTRPAPVRRTPLPPRRRCSPQVAPANEALSEAERVAAELKVEQSTAVMLLLVSKIDQLREAVLAPPRLEQEGKEVLVVVVKVDIAGTPKQGPNIRVARGFPTVVRQRRHTGTPRTGYVAFERSDTGNALTRIEFRDNDSIPLDLQRLDSLWFDSDNNDTSFELIVGYGNRPREVE